MSDVIERQNIRRVRAAILRTARRFYGTNVRIELANFLHVAGRSQWTAAQIGEQLQYLVDKEYLRRHIHKLDVHDPDPQVSYSIASRGIDFLNGDLADEAIEL